MIMKVAGCIVVMAACSSFGFFLGGELTRRVRELRELRSIFLLIRGDIRYLKTSLPEAFENAVIRSPGIFSDFFSELAKQLSRYELESLEAVFREAAGTKLGDTALEPADLQQLYQLGGMLGRMDTQMQLSALDWYLEQSEEAVKTLGATIKERVTLYKSLGILGGIFLIVILI